MATITSANATALDAWVGHTVRVLAQKHDVPLRAVAECIGVAVADDDLVTAARGAWDDVLPGLRLVQ